MTTRMLLGTDGTTGTLHACPECGRLRHDALLAELCRRQHIRARCPHAKSRYSLDCGRIFRTCIACGSRWTVDVPDMEAFLDAHQDLLESLFAAVKRRGEGP